MWCAKTWKWKNFIWRHNKLEWFFSSPHSSDSAHFQITSNLLNVVEFVSFWWMKKFNLRHKRWDIFNSCKECGNNVNCYIIKPNCQILFPCKTILCRYRKASSLNQMIRQCQKLQSQNSIKALKLHYHHFCSHSPFLSHFISFFGCIFFYFDRSLLLSLSLNHYWRISLLLL